jgi:hypothetical protein
LTMHFDPKQPISSEFWLVLARQRGSADRFVRILTGSEINHERGVEPIK